MTTIMHRSFADSMGCDWPREIAYKVDGVPVTFAELKADRIKKQKDHLNIDRKSVV